ncbi:symmetrical bis(5'-nucleosyl)-tetraphosphatase [Vibrio sp. SM6]|uniref:Bis(5'-nucleosyl)-tetraphosphatase, symmetrical n=1 Tax=Vibrio agarilyticus TaxID=2726741 RepID=A0A7X8TPD3_9VIBR|nr:symmetrical bis(5'-nucleosyl)-tetraphosphatase [Vibrio agarilyticus]
MATYLVGDLQGCLDELQLLLARVEFDPARDTLWLVGDLVARGPKSLETLRFIYGLGESAKVVLGNHDLHLLAGAYAHGRVKEKDRTAAIFSAPDKACLLEWLRGQPLLQEHDDFVMCHAGISPLWDIATAKHHAKQVEAVLQSERLPWLLDSMYGNSPALWSDDLNELDTLRYTINAFTRMRFVLPNGALDMHCKLPPDEVDSEQFCPWFDWPQRKPLDKTVVFGHWAALSGIARTDVIGLDTGCVWGEVMTMLRWEDKAIFTQAALN